MTNKVRPLKRELDEERPAPLWHRAIAFVLKAVIAIAILAAAGYAGREIMLSAPEAERTGRPRLARLVEVAPVQPATQGPLIEAWGEVVPARTLVLRPEVGGRIVWLNPALTPGGRVAKGEELLRIDDRTLRLDLARAEAAIRQIEARLAVEEGQRQRAQRDLERVPADLTDQQRALVLREPQWNELAAELAAAEAARDAAEVALSKAILHAPFDAVVLSEQVAEGATVGANAEIATLIAADAFRVELAVPVTALDWIDLDGGQPVTLSQPETWGAGRTRQGRIERLSPDLTQTGRMAEVIVMVPDPLAQQPENRGEPALLIGSFLRAEIEGRPVAEAVALPRAWLRDGNRVWVMNAEDRLEIREVDLAWRGAEMVLVADGLATGDRVVTTHLATVAEGMALRLDGGAQAAGAVAEPAEGQER